MLVITVLLVLLGSNAFAVMERDNWPWEVELKCRHDEEMKAKLGKILWFMNLGPTGIRARIYPDKPKYLVVKFVFQDSLSPAAGKIEIEDVIVGANGKRFVTNHIFGRQGPAAKAGWSGPLMELAHHIEDSQGEKGELELIVWPKGDQSKEKKVMIKLKPVGRFAKTFPYDCPRSDKMLEQLCDFIAQEYQSGRPSFKGRGIHCKTHQLLALMASGLPKYQPLIQKEVSRYASKTYDPHGGGFQCWNWGFDGIVMGEYYLLYKDESLRPAMRSLAKAMPDGSHNRSGIYTHRSFTRIYRDGAQPYAAIAAISGLNMLGMSLFKAAGLEYSEELYQNIHQHYLNSAHETHVGIAYCFANADRFNPKELSLRYEKSTAFIKLKDPKKGLSGKGPGYVCPTGMKDIGAYEILWPRKEVPEVGGLPRWTPGGNVSTDWVAAEAGTNILTEMVNGLRMVKRNPPGYKQAPEPTQPYDTRKGSGHLSPEGIGALAHLIGNSDKKSWQYLGMHCANTCALSPYAAFDGHGSSNLGAFWSILGAARSNNATMLRSYFDYMKTFIILAETHNGGMILQPWGRDRPGCNQDTWNDARLLTTATAAILLSLPKKRLQITGAGSPDIGTAGGSPSTTRSKGNNLVAVLTGMKRKQNANSSTSEPENAKPAANSQAAGPEAASPQGKKAAAPAKGTALTSDVMAQWQARFVKKLDALAKNGRRLVIDVSGQKYLVRGANNSSLIVSLQNNELSMPWNWLSGEHRAKLAKAAATDEDIEALLVAAVLHVVEGRNEEAATLFARAALRDAKAVADVKASLGL